MVVIVDAGELGDALKNVLLFGKEKTFAGAVRFDFDSVGTWTLLACDNFVGIKHQIHVDYAGNHEYHYLAPKAVKELEAGLRGQEGDVDIDLEALSIPCPNEQFWAMFETLVDNINKHPIEAGSFDIDFARIGQLRLLNPKGKFPGSFSNFEITGQRFLAWRYGPDTLGVLMPLDRAKLAEVYDNLSEVVWP